LIFYTDADGQYNVSELKEMFPLIDQADIVTGYRKTRCDPLTRIFVSKVYNMIQKMIIGEPCRDVDCSFRLCKRKIFESFRLECDTGAADVEMLAKARRKGFKITEVGVTHRPRIFGETAFDVKFIKLPLPRVVFPLLREMLSLRRKLTAMGRIRAPSD
jgi:hypothetical protein